MKSIDIDIDNPANTAIKLVPTIDSIIEEQKSLTDENDDSKKKVDNLEKTVNDYTPTDKSINNKINDLKNWTDDNYLPRTDFDSGINDLKTWTGTNYASKTDLSEYAKIADVNSAFSELATAIEGV